MQKYLTEYNNILAMLDDIYNRFERCFDLPGCTLWVLYALRGSREPCTQAEICEGLFMPKQSINCAIKRLLEDGDIVLKTGRDRRRKLIVLTEKGEKLAERTVDLMVAEEEKAFLMMTERERTEFLRLFRKYSELLRAGAEIAVHEAERSAK